MYTVVGFMGRVMYLWRCAEDFVELRISHQISYKKYGGRSVIADHGTMYSPAYLFPLRCIKVLLFHLKPQRCMVDLSLF